MPIPFCSSDCFSPPDVRKSSAFSVMLHIDRTSGFLWLILAETKSALGTRGSYE